MRGVFARERVSAAMEAEGLSCRQLARRAGIAPSTLSRLLRDAGTETPHGDTVVALERALSLSRGTLTGMEGAPQQIGLWPGLTTTDGETPEVWVLRALRALPGTARVEAARAAVVAVIEEAVRANAVDPELHQCLGALDAMRAQGGLQGRRPTGRRNERSGARPRTTHRASAMPSLTQVLSPLPAAG